ncbi:class II aldolase/adducin family protein [Streptomyces smyrnaeus]|uniref:class II aldolase/adducin family protein n=1 Tax=Streptomyces TaxID=1883 RepID=UPI001B39A279|nr:MULTISPECIES: class II aldolase/adducin family protein [unclassified Streptomyces]MBQ0867976.1 class II aldolase/adducin family protein [Streptomyces sp. RK75]MBQ1124000.1 class II aldolase/adducin family protein [Streptomyces sp. B15]MBQ1159311.1 class II aldolase/adducin family protein [Streptomyces sp. A73]
MTQPAMEQATTLDGLVEQLIDVGATAVRRGFVLASGGNLSARLPGREEFVVTGKGTWLDRLTPKDFTVLNLAGEAVGGNPHPSSEWKLHQRTYQVRGDINAIVHMHPQHAVLVDALGHEIRLLTLDHAVYVRSIGRTDFYPNGSDELADTAAEQAKEHNCVLLAHHGCSALGEDVGMAFRRAMNLEEAATATYRALLLGDRTTRFPVTADEAIQHA